MSKELVAKPLVKNIYQGIRDEVENMDRKPVLSIVQVGEDPASEYYINSLKKKGGKCSIEVRIESFELQTGADQIIKTIHKLNKDTSVDAIMIQKPLPAHIDDFEVTLQIDPEKDVDGLHPLNVGRLVLGRDGFVPATPAAVLELIKFYEIRTEGKHVVIVGRSDIVGKPLVNLFLHKNETGNATVTVCHSRTNDLAGITKQADILVAAIGKAFFIKKEQVKSGAIIIDVGINEYKENEKVRYVGDVDFEDCYDTVSKITPVPGGIGSITTAMLLNNVLIANKTEKKNKKVLT